MGKSNRFGICGLAAVLASIILLSGCATGAHSGGGTSVTSTHSVDLGWGASPSSTGVAYNIYRSSASGGPYQLLNSSPTANLSYTDPTVQTGKTYFYVVTAVDSGGVESAFSNETTATIPNP